MAPEADRSIAALFGTLVSDLGTLMHQELRAAASEMVDRVRAAVRNVLLVIVAAILGAVALLVLTGGVVLALGELVPMWISALVIGGALGFGAYALFEKATGALRTVDLLPRNTFASLADHRAWAKEEIHATRDRLASTLSETREHVDATVKETRENVSAALRSAPVIAAGSELAEAMREAAATVRETTSAVRETRDEVAATVKETHAHVAATVKETREHVAATAKDNREQLAAAVAANRDELVSAVTLTREQLVATLEELFLRLLAAARDVTASPAAPKRDSLDP